MERAVDVVIVGAGTAGLSAAREVRKVTDSFLLVQDGPHGTTCARVGCMPSKALLQSADDFHRRQVFPELGIRGGEGLSLDGNAALSRVRRLRDYFVGFVLESVENYRAQGKLIEARAELVDERTLRLSDGTTILAKAILVAVGSTPIVPESWRPFADRVLTSDTIFELSRLPESLAVIGTGVIGIELGQAMHRLGVRVAIFGRNVLMAGLQDPKVNQAAVTTWREEMDITLGSEVKVEASGDGIRVTAGRRSMDAAMVLSAMGRRSHGDTFGLGRLGALERNAETTRLGDTSVFVAGDAAADRPVLHEASDEGHIAGYNAGRLLRGEPMQRFRRRTRLGIVFSEPNVAVVGAALDELDDPLVGEVSFTDQGRSRVMARNAGLLRIYADRRSGELRGAELVGPAGEHLAHLLAWAIQLRLTAIDALRMPFYHPVVEEGLRTALRDVARQLPHPSPAEIAFCEEESGVEPLS